MGRNKPRSKAVDVTKSLLQPTSVTDHIAVQISPNVVIQVAEEDLSPTQGSEAAFALRREGKLDTTMKLCLNWRQGNCHNHAACSFAHVVRYFGVMGDLPSPVTTGRTSVFGATGAGGTYSSVTAGGGGSIGRGGGANANASWSQKLAPPSYAAANRNAPPRTEERKAPAAASVPVEAKEAKAASTPPAQAAAATAAAAAAATTTTAGDATAAAGGHIAEPAEVSQEVPATTSPTPVSTATATPVVRPAAAPASAEAVDVPPAVLNAEGLRSVLASLAPAVAKAAAVEGEKEAETAEAAEGERERIVVDKPDAFLARLSTRPEPSAAPWQSQPCGSRDEVVETLGKAILGDFFTTSKEISELYVELCRRRQQSQEPQLSVLELFALRRLRQQRQAARSPGVEASAPAYPYVRRPDRFFSTAPTMMPAATSSIGQFGNTGMSLGGGQDTGLDDGDPSAPGLAYQSFINMFAPEED